MGTKTFNNYEDLLTFTRASKGHALRPVSYGSELVTNGTFDTDVSGWSDDSSAGGSIAWNSSGYLNLAATTGTSRASQSIDTTAGDIYFISLEVIALNGSTGPVLYFDGVQQGSALTVGTTTFVYVATGSSVAVSIRNFTTGTTVYIDNVSVKEVLFDQPDGTLTLFEHPNNIPRVEWDADRNRLGLLVEEARTNLITYSEDFNTSWNKVNSTVTSDDTAGPDVLESADLLVTNTANAQHRLDFVPTSSAGTQTFSVYLKAEGYSESWLRIGSDGAFFDLSDGTIGTTTGGITPIIQEVGNGWYRCSITTTTASANDTIRINVVSTGGVATFAGDGTSGIYIYGAQLEAGSFPTSYIKSNSGSTTTRSADVASIPVADFGFNDDGYSFVIEAEAPYAVEINQDSFFVTLDGDTDLYMYANNIGTQGEYQLRSSGGDIVLAEDSVTIDDVMKMGFGFKKNNCVMTLNGETVANDTSATLPTGVTDLLLGRSGSGGQKFVHIKSIKYYPRRLTNAQLQALTEPRSTPTLSLTFDGLESSYTENYIHG